MVMQEITERKQDLHSFSCTVTAVYIIMEYNFFDF